MGSRSYPVASRPFSPHYDAETQRRPLHQRLVGEGELPDGYAADDHVAFVFRGTELSEVVSTTQTGRGYRIARGADGRAIETELPTRYLG